MAEDSRSGGKIPELRAVRADVSALAASTVLDLSVPFGSSCARSVVSVGPVLDQRGSQPFESVVLPPFLGDAVFILSACGNGLGCTKIGNVPSAGLGALLFRDGQHRVAVRILRLYYRHPGYCLA